MTPSDRLLAAYSPDRLAEALHRTADLLRDHFAKVVSREGHVLNWNPPEPNICEAGRWLTTAPAADEEAPDWSRLDAIVREMLSRGHNLHHPRYIGHQVPASLPVAAVFDLIAAVTNQVMAIYEMGPWATSVERALIDELGRRFGLTEQPFAGLVTNGGSLANLTALLTARNVTLGNVWEQGLARSGQPPVLIVQADAHYGIARSAGILGLGVQQVLRVPLDERRRMDVAALDRIVTDCRRRGQPIVAVAACACATPTGAFDPLEEIAEVCRRHGVWMHVDAAHGGGAIFSDTYRSRLAGLSQADSFVCDAHKMLFVPALCAFVFYRNADHRFSAFRQEAPYLFNASVAGGTSEYDNGLLTVECTKRAAAYPLWGIWSLFGPALFGELVDRTFGLGHRFWELLEEADDFEALHEPECNIVCFRYVPEPLRSAPEQEIARVHGALRRALIESGEFYIVQTNLDGNSALRVTMMNPLTTEDDLRALLDAIRRYGMAAINDNGTSSGDQNRYA